MSRRITCVLSTFAAAACVVPAWADATLGSGGDADEANQVRVAGASWVRSDDPTRLAGPEVLFIGGASQAANEFIAYISFDLSGATGTATGATLSLWNKGAATFNANGGVNDLGVTPLNIMSLTDTITGFGESGYMGVPENVNSAVVDGSGLPADYLEVPLLFDQVIGTAGFDIDTIGDGVQMDITFNAAGLAYINNRLGGILTLGLDAPDAAALATNTGARNFFNIAGVVESAGTETDDIAPSLTILGIDLPSDGLPGDTDGDGDIDDADLGTAFSNFTGPVGAAGGKTAAQGDTDGDGDVDDADLANAFSGFTGPLGPASVPEPSGLALIGLGALTVARRRRRV